MRSIQRVADAFGKLLPPQRAIKFLAPLTVRDVPETAAGSTLTGAGGSGEVSGFHEVGLDGTAVRGVELVFFAALYSTSQLGEQSFGARMVQTSIGQPWATAARFRAEFARGNLSGPVHVDLYRPSDSVVLATLTTSSATGESVEADVTSTVIGAAEAILVARAYSDVDTLINNLFTKMNLHFADDGVHDGTDTAISAVTYPPAVDLATRIARINAMCAAYEAHRVKGSGVPIHINVGGDTTNALDITAAATTNDEAKARVLDLQTQWNAHVADGSTWHNTPDTTNAITGPASVSVFYAGLHFS